MKPATAELGDQAMHIPSIHQNRQLFQPSPDLIETWLPAIEDVDLLVYCRLDPLTLEPYLLKQLLTWPQPCSASLPNLVISVSIRLIRVFRVPFFLESGVLPPHSKKKPRFPRASFLHQK